MKFPKTGIIGLIAIFCLVSITAFSGETLRLGSSGRSPVSPSRSRSSLRSSPSRGRSIESSRSSGTSINRSRSLTGNSSPSSLRLGPSTRSSSRTNISRARTTLPGRTYSRPDRSAITRDSSIRRSSRPDSGSYRLNDNSWKIRSGRSIEDRTLSRSQNRDNSTLRLGPSSGNTLRSDRSPVSGIDKSSRSSSLLKRVDRDFSTSRKTEGETSIQRRLDSSRASGSNRSSSLRLGGETSSRNRITPDRSRYDHNRYDRDHSRRSSGRNDYNSCRPLDRDDEECHRYARQYYRRRHYRPYYHNYHNYYTGYTWFNNLGWSISYFDDDDDFFVHLGSNYDWTPYWAGSWWGNLYWADDNFSISLSSNYHQRRTWISGYWRTIYDQVEYVDSWGRIRYRTVRRQEWVPGYWRYW